jgi:copper chaperone
VNTTATYSVAGMSCEHCVKAVSGELLKLDGVSAVQVDLERGVVEVTSDHQLAESDVAAAVDEAGYELVP